MQQGMLLPTSDSGKRSLAVTDAFASHVSLEEAMILGGAGGELEV